MLKLLKRLIGTGTAPTEERRRFDRFPSHGKAWVQLGVYDADVVSAVIRDISRGGVSLGIDRSVDAGTMLRISLPNTTTTVLACVAHVRPMVDETFILGCKFSMELSDADLEALGSRREKPKQADQRAWERVPSAAQAQYSLVDQAGEAKKAEVHNISPAGVALITNQEITPGALLNLELRAREGRPIVTVVACVVYLSAYGEGQWLAGCNFVRELTDEDLKALIAQTP
jgi:hypothetical protein